MELEGLSIALSSKIILSISEIFDSLKKFQMTQIVKIPETLDMNKPQSFQPNTCKFKSHFPIIPQK